MQRRSKVGREREKRHKGFKPALASIMMGKVRSLANKTDELEVLTMIDNKGRQIYIEEWKKQGWWIVNNRWFNPGHATVNHHICSLDIEILAVNFCPHYLPRVHQCYYTGSLHPNISWHRRCV